MEKIKYEERINGPTKCHKYNSTCHDKAGWDESIGIEVLGKICR